MGFYFKGRIKVNLIVIAVISILNAAYFYNHPRINNSYSLFWFFIVLTVSFILMSISSDVSIDEKMITVIHPVLNFSKQIKWQEIAEIQEQEIDTRFSAMDFLVLLLLFGWISILFYGAKQRKLIIISKEQYAITIYSRYLSQYDAAVDKIIKIKGKRQKYPE